MRSKFGRYTDFKHEKIKLKYEILSLSEPYMTENPWANDSFAVKFIEQERIEEYL